MERKQAQRQMDGDEAVHHPSRNTRKRICMIAYSNYELDNRVRRYAETLASRGDDVHVISLSTDQFRSPLEDFHGVTVHRVQHRNFDERSKWSYAGRLLRFLWRSSRTLRRLHRQNRFDLIHVHNMPDFLVFSAWYPKLTGAKIILDIHDIVPELFQSKFKTSLASGYVSLLKMIEWLSVRFADHIIVSNHLWRDTLIGRSLSKEKCSVFVNHVDPKIFFRHARTRKDDRIIILFPGSFQWHQGLDIAMRAFAKVRSQVPTAEFHLYGPGDESEAELKRLASHLSLGESVKFFEKVVLDRIADVMANADLGVVPKRANSFGNEAYSTKIMEFMSQGVPVVASRTKIDTYYFSDDVVEFFPSGDSDAMAEAMLKVINNRERRDQLIARGYDYAERNGWDLKQQEYTGLVDALCAGQTHREQTDSHNGQLPIDAHGHKDDICGGESVQDLPRMASRKAATD